MVAKLAAWPAHVTWIQPNGCLTPEASRWLNRIAAAAVNANTATGEDLSSQLAALAASDMVMQPSVGVDALLPDVMQGAEAGRTTEATWQTNPSI